MRRYGIRLPAGNAGVQGPGFQALIELTRRGNTWISRECLMSLRLKSKHKHCSSSRANGSCRNLGYLVSGRRSSCRRSASGR
jgi:hypothetical protein